MDFGHQDQQKEGEIEDYSAIGARTNHLVYSLSAWIHAACDLLPLTSMLYPEDEFITQTSLPVGFLFAQRPSSVDVAWHCCFQQHLSWYPTNLDAPQNSIVPSIIESFLDSTYGKGIMIRGSINRIQSEISPNFH